jgi:GTP-binding protein
MLGFPNVGKSTFVASVSRGRPRGAAYTITTHPPHPRVVSDRREGARNFVIADLPGLIAGASEGIGLGTRFLRHVERTRLLLHFVTLTDEPGRDPVSDYMTVRREVLQFSEKLAERGEIVCLSRADLPEVREAYPELKEEFASRFGTELHLVSSATRFGVDRLLELIAQKLPQRTSWEPIPG